ncbi:MAG: hypothetical protein ABI397_02720 [Candidatus Saccharimonas sp.]
MARLEKVFFQDPEGQIAPTFEGPIVVEQKNGQYRMEWLEVTTYKEKAGTFANLGGVAIASSAEFNGYLSLAGRDGSLSLRYDEVITKDARSKPSPIDVSNQNQPELPDDTAHP